VRETAQPVTQTIGLSERKIEMSIVKIVSWDELKSGVDCPGCRFPIDLNVGEVAMLYQHGGDLYCPACKGHYGIEKHSPTRASQQSVKSDEAVCSAKYHLLLAEKGDTVCGVCLSPLRR
jgi:hypothetical protein